jgi:hypothetical protein
MFSFFSVNDSCDGTGLSLRETRRKLQEFDPTKHCDIFIPVSPIPAIVSVSSVRPHASQNRFPLFLGKLDLQVSVNICTIFLFYNFSGTAGDKPIIAAETRDKIFHRTICQQLFFSSKRENPEQQ